MVKEIADGTPPLRLDLLKLTPKQKSSSWTLKTLQVDLKNLSCTRFEK